MSALNNATNNPSVYDSVWRGLHWAMAFLVISVLVVIEVKGELPKGELRRQLMSWHKQAGVAVFLLIWARLWWRHTHRTPAIVPPLSNFMKRLAGLAHFGLYALMILLPVLGVLFQQARGNEVVFLGWTLPWILNDTSAIHYAKPMKSVHEWLGNAMIWLVGLHVASALFHHWIRRDNTLVRMLKVRRS
jgi:cytochrome b561